MHALKVLHKKLHRACPFIHQYRLTILLLATEAVLVGQRLSLTQIGRRLTSTARVKHRIKRIDRLLGNAHLQQEHHAIYRFVCHELLQGQARPLIIVDWSDLTSERDYHVLRASVPVGGRALTLYEEVHPQHEIVSHRVHKRFLHRVHKMLPAGCCPIIVTDAGFRNPWFKVVRALGWDYVGRVRNRDLLMAVDDDVWVPCKGLYRHAQYQPRYLGEFTVVRSNPMNTHLYIVKQRPKGRHCYNDDGTRTRRGHSEKKAKRQKEPWLITTSLADGQFDAKRIIKVYKTRMQIEEAFRDIKSARIGLSIRESLTRDLERLTILLLIGNLATLMSWLLGTLAELKQWHRQYQSNSNKHRRILSTFFIGCQMARENPVILKQQQYERALSHVRLNAMAQPYA